MALDLEWKTVVRSFEEPGFKKEATIQYILLMQNEVKQANIIDYLQDSTPSLEDKLTFVKKVLALGPGPGPCYVDEVHQGQMEPGCKLIYVALRLRHIMKAGKDYVCDVHAMCDTGASAAELTMPASKARQLGLQIISTMFIRGWPPEISPRVEMAVLSAIRVSVQLKDPETGVTVLKVADLVPVANKLEFETWKPIPQQKQGRLAWEHGEASYPKESDDEVELSPVKRPSIDRSVPTMILGLDGLKKLGLRIDPLGSMLFPVIEEGIIV